MDLWHGYQLDSVTGTGLLRQGVYYWDKTHVYHNSMLVLQYVKMMGWHDWDTIYDAESFTMEAKHRRSNSNHPSPALRLTTTETLSVMCTH